MLPSLQVGPRLRSVFRVVRGSRFNDLAALRAFCKAPPRAGSTHVTLLLNEAATGERFWNVLCSQPPQPTRQECT